MGLLMLNGHAYAGFTEPAEIYSTEEREVGVWTDGKPLYQKSFLGIDFANGRRDYQHGIANVDKIFINHSATFIYKKDKTEFAPFLFTGYNDQAQFVEGYGRIIQTVTPTVITLKANANIYSDYTADITLLYTKTTDTAGSGKWTTSGVPAHHYSTNEQVVGTWIDGKPLYEKVVQTTFSATTHEGNQVYSGFIDISSEIPNIDMAWLDKNMSWYNPTSPQTRGFFAGWYEQDEGKIFVLTLYSRSNVPCTLVIRYTKTTD